jgi:hypothetical protein
MLKSLLNIAAAAAFFAAAPALAQIEEIDPNRADEYQAGTYDADASEATPETWQQDPAPSSEWTPAEPQPWQAAPAETAATPPAQEATVPREDVFTAAEGLFGRGAEGLADLIEYIFRDRGEPTAYIVGQEAGGAFVFGVRYGSGVMRHQVEGERDVYWTGPSLGFDFGADANKVFVLVYNLHDSQDLFRRFPGAEGNAYFVGGFTAQYLRRGDVVLIPIRMGVGLRLGVNAGYMRFSERNRWVPF